MFEAFDRTIFPDKLLAEGESLPLFVDECVLIHTQGEKASRVWKGVEKKLSGGAIRALKAVWLSEESESDELLFRYLRKTFNSTASIETNMGDQDVLDVMKLARTVNREAEHIRQFVRFQKTADGIFFAPIEPKYNALPLSVDYFHDRFRDQEWVVYDVKRGYGFHYDLKHVSQFTFEGEEPLLISGSLQAQQLDNSEGLYEDFWKSYIQSLTIRERLNPRLQRQHMPVRFWKYLTEKR